MKCGLSESGPDIAGDLLALGHGHIALVVDEYSATDDNGVGAHAYLMVNESGAINVVDPGFDVTHGFPPQPRRGLSATHAAFYSPQGYPAYPIAHQQDPAVPPGSHHGLVGGDGVRRFHIDEQGDAFGHSRLRTWHRQPPQVRAALHAYEKASLVDSVLRQNLSDAELADLVVRLRWSSAILRTLAGPEGGPPELTALYARRGELLADGPGTRAATRELQALNIVPDDPRPAARWEQIQQDAETFDEIAAVHSEHFGRSFGPETIRHQIAQLDLATTHVLPLTEPIRVIRGLDDIGFLATDAHGGYLNVPQRELGFLSTSVASCARPLVDRASDRDPREQPADAGAAAFRGGGADCRIVRKSAGRA
ncbi:hypothetical protein [Nocardia vaccinii]|uniref:hypothetical protein n=1 Tax=Nocardia vaccinii TaxID=1822 RepID=UPI0008348A6C|nr:hypothetical protein [Nocardia vaccinii]